MGPVDLAVLTVKDYDVESTLPALAALRAHGPMAVLTLQNGVDAPETVANAQGREAVLAGSAYISVELVAPGVVAQTGTHQRLVFGELEGGSAPSERALATAALLTAAGFEGQAVADGRVALWEKLTFLAPFSGFTAAARAPLGRIWGDMSLRPVFREAVREVARVARAEGAAVALPEDASIDQQLNALPAGMRSSLLVDLERGRRLELEAIQGAVVRRGQARGVPTPVLATIYAVLKPHASGRTAAEHG